MPARLPSIGAKLSHDLDNLMCKKEAPAVSNFRQKPCDWGKWMENTANQEKAAHARLGKTAGEKNRTAIAPAPSAGQAAW